MQAIIETGGKQLRVAVGDIVFVEKLAADVAQDVVFDKVLALGEDKMKFGTPYLKNATVTGSVVKQGRNKKIIVFRYRAKHNVRVKRGHRQPYTMVKITAIEG